MIAYGACLLKSLLDVSTLFVPYLLRELGLDITSDAIYPSEKLYYI